MSGFECDFFYLYVLSSQYIVSNLSKPGPSMQHTHSKIIPLVLCVSTMTITFQTAVYVHHPKYFYGYELVLIQISCYLLEA